MSSRWSETWADEVAALEAEWLADLATEVTLRLEVSGTEDGDQACAFVLGRGALRAVAPATLDQPDVVVTLIEADATALLEGVDPNVAFMQGRMKVAGSMGVVLDLLARTRRASYAPWRAAVAACSG